LSGIIFGPVGTQIYYAADAPSLIEVPVGIMESSF
jgi:hypothetical protein